MSEVSGIFFRNGATFLLRFFGKINNSESAICCWFFRHDHMQTHQETSLILGFSPIIDLAIGYQLSTACSDAINA
jgi:hypothetical protein